MKRKFWIILLVVFVVIQFKQMNKLNPPYSEADDFFAHVEAPDQVKSLLVTACYDCHSHQSKYPWYSNVAPVSWWMEGHITEGREHTNFSTWGTKTGDERSHMIAECIEVLEKKEMPVLTYMIMHNDAWIDESERAELADFFKGLK